jgi:hypothetical protein
LQKLPIRLKKILSSRCDELIFELMIAVLSFAGSRPLRFRCHSCTNFRLGAVSSWD